MPYLIMESTFSVLASCIGKRGMKWNAQVRIAGWRSFKTNRSSHAACQEDLDLADVLPYCILRIFEGGTVMRFLMLFCLSIALVACAGGGSTALRGVDEDDVRKSLLKEKQHVRK